MKTFSLIVLGPGNMNNYTINTRIGRFIEFSRNKHTQQVINSDNQKSQEVLGNLFLLGNNLADKYLKGIKFFSLHLKASDKSTATTESTVADANTSDESNTMSHAVSSMGDGVSHMGDMSDLGMVSLAGVSDFHDGAAVSAVSVIGHVLDPAVGERDAVLALDVAGLVPAPALAEVCAVVVVMDPVGEVEGVGLVTLLMVSTTTSVTNEAPDTIRHGEAGAEASEDGETSD